MKHAILKNALAVLLFFAVLQESYGQSILDDYITEGLQNNLVLKNKNIDLNQSLLALKDARSYFLPSLDLGATYNLAQGGRVIDFPVGDLLNDVYSSLNALLDQQQFPQLENVQEQFLPNNFYDARVRVSYPVLNKDLYYNKRVREESVQLEEYEVKIFEAELEKNIKQAYYNFCMAHTAIEILENSQLLVEQNLKVNQSLKDNGKALPAQLLRAESELENIKSQLIEANNKLQNATYYVNFLLNRSLDASVKFEEPGLDEGIYLNLLQEKDHSRRAEILKINKAQNIQQHLLRSNQNYAIPNVSAFLDLGLQGFNFEVNEQSRYYLFGLQLSMPLFHGGRNKNAISSSQLNLESLNHQEALLNSQIEMAIRTSKNNIKASQAAKSSAESNLKASTAYLKLLEKGYREGVNSLIEFIDARNQYTNAALKVSIANYNLLNAIADLERELTSLQ
ncbi:TolC family protein [Marivirga sp. S37H4]|uniref:TolC family protein n=1 Tax=Marivirga aurantiaca TaxID=2802615 RepID=A0A934X1G1_9BACT|nr:TolC family protein [Marivirga aurantiaca]MBK6266570.1 TolC family protein [Marivirga aurantiaca]